MSLLPPPLKMLHPSLSLSSKCDVAHRILHSLNTCTSPSILPRFLALLLRHHLLSDTRLAAAFLSTSAALRSLPSPLPFLSLLPHRPPPAAFFFHSLFPAAPDPLLLYSRMLAASLRPNNYTLPLLLKPLAALRRLRPGQALHAHALLTGHAADLFVRNSLLSLYSACRDLHSCERLFDEMPHREVVAWSTMIAAYHHAGCHAAALAAFERMHRSSVSPNRVTMINALAACAAGGAVDTGAWIHGCVSSLGWELDVVLGTALVDMYGKCGRNDLALDVFMQMRHRNVYTWNSLIGGLATAKNGEDAVAWFFRMEHEGVQPDPVTLIGVLWACGRSGLVEKGRGIFQLMMDGKYGFRPGIKHYGCLVDLLGRAGYLGEALECVEGMPYEPNVVIWGSLLSGCRSLGDSQLSEFAARRLVELEPWNVIHYVVLSGLYAEMGRWSDAEGVRRLMKERGLRKDPGWSFAEYDETRCDVIETCAV